MIPLSQRRASVFIQCRQRRVVKVRHWSRVCHKAMPSFLDGYEAPFTSWAIQTSPCMECPTTLGAALVVRGISYLFWAT